MLRRSRSSLKSQMDFYNGNRSQNENLPAVNLQLMVSWFEEADPGDIFEKSSEDSFSDLLVYKCGKADATAW